MVQVKEVMLLSQPNPEKHRPAKPSGDSGLNTLLAIRGKYEYQRIGIGPLAYFAENESGSGWDLENV